MAKKPREYHVPPSIAEEWKTYRLAVYGLEPMHPEQFAQVRDAFYAGYSALIVQIMTAKDAGATTDLNDVAHEAVAFGEQKQKEQGHEEA